MDYKDQHNTFRPYSNEDDDPERDRDTQVMPRLPSRSQQSRQHAHLNQFDKLQPQGGRIRNSSVRNAGFSNQSYQSSRPDKRVRNQKSFWSNRRAEGCAISPARLLLAIILLGVVVIVGYLILDELGVLDPGNGKVPAWNGHDRLNVLLIGLDQRRDEPTRSDTLVVYSFDPATGQTTMLSVPRDLWVELPVTRQQDRINGAYQYGGAPAAIEAVQKTLGIPIRYSAVVKFDGFRNIVDAVGGITINVPRAINDPTYPADVGYGYKPIAIPAGVHHMNGEVALEYVRSRHDDPLGDLGRNERQQQVLLAIKQQLLSPTGIIHLPAVLAALDKAVVTDMPRVEELHLARSLIFSRGAVQRQALDYSRNAVSDITTAGGAQVLEPNYPVIYQITRKLFTDLHLLNEGAAITILNGSGQPGVAHSLADRLIAQGYHITKIDNASRNDYTHTVVIENRNAPYTAQQMGILFRTPVQHQLLSEATGAVVIIVGRDEDISPEP